MNESSKKVLVIDDDPAILFLHEIIIKEGKLSNNPYAFLHAGEALDFILPIDSAESRILIFLDINMPKINGWEFLNLLEEKITQADIKVVMVTSSLSQTEREKSNEYGVVIDFWEKPMDDVQVEALIEKLGDWLVD